MTAIEEFFVGIIIVVFGLFFILWPFILVWYIYRQKRKLKAMDNDKI